MENKKYYLFDNEQEFKYLIGDSLAYKNMQNIVSKLVGYVRPNYMIEFGSGSGVTSIRLAKENNHTSIVAVDVRETMIGLSQEKMVKNRIKNLTFVNGDLTKLSNFNLKNCNLVLLMYSFKYIPDPLGNKTEFLKGLYSRMQKGAYIIIGDTFIEENASKQEIKKQFENIYYNSSLDSFWDDFAGLEDEQIQFVENIQNEIIQNTKIQVDYAVNREGVYPVSINWLLETAKEIGFKCVTCKNLNNLNDAIIILKR